MKLNYFSLLPHCQTPGVNGISSGIVPLLASIYSHSLIVASALHAIFQTAPGVFGLYVRCTSVTATLLQFMTGTRVPGSVILFMSVHVAARSAANYSSKSGLMAAVVSTDSTSWVASPTLELASKHRFWRVWTVHV